MSENAQFSREKVFESIVKEAGEFYNLIITIAVAFLGGTLLFTEKICPEPSKQTLWYLFIGWFFLALAIGCIAWVRWKNIQSGTLFLQNQFQKAIKVDYIKEIITGISFIFLLLGILFLIIFGGINFYFKSNKEIQMSNKDWRQDSIPYGSIQQPASSNQPIQQQPIPSSIPESNGSSQPIPDIPKEK